LTKCLHHEFSLAEGGIQNVEFVRNHSLSWGWVR